MSTNLILFRQRFTSLVNNQAVRLPRRTIHTTQSLTDANLGDDPIKNPRIAVANEVTTFEHHKMPQELLDYEFNYPICRDTMGIKWPGYWFKRKFVYVKEMEPELVVPDLTDFELKPYVSYRAEEVDVPPLTAKALFEDVYAEAIAADFKTKGIEEYNLSHEDIDKARLAALQTGADMFEEYTKEGVRKHVEYDE